MIKTFFTSDQHFGHNGIIKYESRPFEGVIEMSHFMISQWNITVGKNDIVYHAGDFSFMNKEETKKVFDKLYGRKRLIMGNHDRARSVTWWKDIGFEEVYEFPICYKDFYWISHEPMYMNERMPYVNCHGHLHSKKYEGNNHINLCVEHWNYRPLQFEQIQAILEERKEGDKI